MIHRTKSTGDEWLSNLRHPGYNLTQEQIFYLMFKFIKTQKTYDPITFTPIRVIECEGLLE